MRAHHLQQTRPQWYDRNPVIVGSQGSVLAAPPFGIIVVSQYTVPANRKFLLEAAQCTLWRDTAAAAVGTYQTKISLTQPLEGGGIMPQCVSTNNTPQARIDLFAAVQAIIKESGVLQVTAEDLSTGGTTTSYWSYKGTEYDAQ